MKKWTFAVQSRSVQLIAMVIEMIAFAVIAILKIQYSRTHYSAGWLPSNLIELPMLYIALLVNTIAIPIFFERLYKKDKGVTFLVVLCASVGILLVMSPFSISDEITNRMASLRYESPKYQIEHYLQFVDDLRFRRLY